MTSALFELIRIGVAIALLVTLAVGLGWAGWLGLSYLGSLKFGRPRPRLVTNERRSPPGREPLRPRSDLAWRHGRHDLRDQDAEPRGD